MGGDGSTCNSFSNGRYKAAMSAQASGREKVVYNHSKNDYILFWGCFAALIATAFGFIVRAQIIGDWETQFNLTETQKGEILGVGLWPFAISIVLFSLVVDKIGYGKAMVITFFCHAFPVLTISATNYQMLCGERSLRLSGMGQWKRL
jgi:MFS family permease